MLNWVESERRMNLRKCGYNVGFLDKKGLSGFYGHVL